MTGPLAATGEPLVFLWSVSGAPTVAELEAMRDEAASAGAEVFMGFNKNVSSYLARSRDFAGERSEKSGPASSPDVLPILSSGEPHALRDFF